MGNIYAGVSVGVGFILFCFLMAVILIVFKNLKKRMLPEKKGAEAFDLFDFNTEEKRNNLRVDIAWPVLMETTGGTIKAETKDLSRSGAFVKCSKPLFPGEQLRMTIEIPGQKSVMLNSEVVWSNGGVPDDKVVFRGMGIRFIKNRVEDCEELIAALSRCLEDSHSNRPFIAGN